MVTPVSNNSFYFTGITAPGGNSPQAAAVPAETSAVVNTTDSTEISKDAMDASRAITGVREPKESDNREIDAKKPESENPTEEQKEMQKEAVKNAPQKQAVGIQYKYYEDINRSQTNIVDKESGEIVKQIPPDQKIKISQSLAKILGNVLDKRA